MSATFDIFDARDVRNPKRHHEEHEEWLGWARSKDIDAAQCRLCVVLCLEFSVEYHITGRFGRGGPPRVFQDGCEFVEHVFELLNTGAQCPTVLLAIRSLSV